MLRFPPSDEINIIILLLAFLQVHKDHILTIEMATGRIKNIQN